MNRLKELRKEEGLTQKELADKIGVHYRTLQNMENGESQIKPDKAQQLADYFGVRVAYLLGYSDYKNKEDFIEQQTREELKLSPSEKKLRNQIKQEIKAERQDEKYIERMLSLDLAQHFTIAEYNLERLEDNFDDVMGALLTREEKNIFNATDKEAAQKFLHLADEGLEMVKVWREVLFMTINRNKDN